MISRREQYQVNKDQINAARRARAQRIGWGSANKLRVQMAYRHSLKGKLTAWKFSAKVREIPWSLSLGDLEQLPQQCFYTATPLTFKPNKFETISLDRVDSSKGYEPGNVVFCCDIINKMKQESTIEEFFHLCELVLHNRDATLQNLRKHDK